MHQSAMIRMKWFVDNYVPKDKKVKVLDIGSYSVNGNYKELFKGTQVEYVGLDITEGPNVDIAVKDPYSWIEIPDESFDFIISGNAFEHIEYPWLTIKEIFKKLKWGGFVCILAPFRLGEHRYPTDCYRYYPDGFRALAKWGGLKVINVTLGGLCGGLTTHSSENYDDTMLVAAKALTEEGLDELPKLTEEGREYTIIRGN